MFPLWSLPHRQRIEEQEGLPGPGEYQRPPPPYNLAGVPRERNRAQMKEQSKTSEKELNYEEIANLFDGEFKALVIKMFTELTQLG